MIFRNSIVIFLKVSTSLHKIIFQQMRRYTKTVEECLNLEAKKLAQSMNVSKEERHLSNINWYRSTVSIVNFEYFFLFIRQLQRDIQTPVKHLGWSVLRKRVNGYEPLTNFAKHSILDVWQGSACASELHFCSYLVTWFEELKSFFF